jgi:hypothetical protein
LTLPGDGDPDGSYATAGITLGVIGTCKPPCHIKAKGTEGIIGKNTLHVLFADIIIKMKVDL